jgi:hypothetical protein
MTSMKLGVLEVVKRVFLSPKEHKLEKINSKTF